MIAVAIVLGAWLIVSGTIAIAGSFAAREVLPQLVAAAHHRAARDPAGVLALANPGATLAALMTVAGIWAIAVGVMRVVLAFEVKRLPGYVEQAFNTPAATVSPPNTSLSPRRLSPDPNPDKEHHHEAVRSTDQAGRARQAGEARAARPSTRRRAT